MTLQYPAIPAPQADVKSLWDCVMAQKQIIEILLGQLGKTKVAAAVTWQDLVDLGLIEQSQVPDV